MMKANPKVSVIVPVYNVEKYLKECLTSICHQSYANIEIIVIDDGSTDNGKKIIESFKEVKYYYQENAGQGRARNYGVSLATGDWICFCDADDYLDKNYISKMMEHTTEEIGIVVCNIMRRMEDGSTTVDRLRCLGELNQKQALISINPGPTNKLFRKEVLKDNHFLEGKIRYEDLAIFPKLMIDAKKVYVIDDVLYYYRIYNDSTMRKWDHRIHDIFTVLDFVSKQDYYQVYKEEIDYLIFKHCLFGHLSRIVYFDSKYQKQELKIAEEFVLEKVPNYAKNKYIMQEKTPWFYLGVRMFRLGILSWLLLPLRLVEKRVTR